MDNVDEKEVAKFASLASRWWDKNSEFKPLHEINPLRLGYIQEQCQNINGKTILDVGCGGGILAESMAQAGAKVTGIDVADASIEVAKLHLLESGLNVEYKKISAEQLASSSTKKFDVITCLEMLEHVPDPSSIINACTELLKPGGKLFLSTINRNLRSYFMAIVGAEYVLKLLPKGTHDYDKFIQPAQIDNWARQADLSLQNMIGMSYNPITKTYKLDSDVRVNYMCFYVKNS